MRMSVALFAYAGVEPVTHQCLVRDLLAMRGHDVEYMCIWDDADLGRARAKLAARFLEGHGDVLIMIDHDLVWGAGDLERMAALAHERQCIVGPAVPKRTMGQGLASCLPEPFPMGWVGQDHVVPATWIAGAMIIIPRAAVEAVCKLPEVQTRNGIMPFMQAADPESGTFLTEDWSFCARARRCGFGCLMDTKPLIGHLGRHLFTVSDAIRDTDGDMFKAAAP